MQQLTKNFTKDEFSCPCCGFNIIDHNLVNRLQLLRDTLNESLVVKSGCRCKKHNAEVGGTPDSAHLYGKAADILCPDSGFRYRFLSQAFKLFARIEVPNGPWIHVDIDESKPQNVCFTR